MFTRTRPVPSSASAAGSELAESRADVDAVTAVVQALARATTSEDAVRNALEVVRERFGWVYGSYWRVADSALHLAQESGDAGEEFRRVTRAASFREGVGLSGRAWRQRDLVFVADLGELTDCVRAPAAQRAGVRSGICFPLTEDGVVTGTMDFFATETLRPSPRRLTTLRSIGVLVSQALERVATAERQASATQDIEAVNRVIHEVTGAPSADQALSRALTAIREGFDWAYGSYWAVDESDRALHFVQETGDAGAEFREVTRTASFREGVGLAGRAWRARDLVFVADLGELTDCVRAPAAQRAGVRSGVCLPVLVDGQVTGTMDFFATETLELSPGRREALRNTGFLVGQALERHAAAERLRTAGEELVTSIQEVERNVLAATSVATDGRRLAQDANEEVAGLGRSSAEIGQVVTVIQGIAAQTNLLALNATIEAARAGDAGRGFAVVAHEVKELATETAAATTQVGDKVRTIQQQVEGVIASLAQIGGVVERINETQQTIGGVLTEQVAVTRAILD
ncbi:GAF domain-containing protein [Cellulomonas endometrii]|uniref:GAF domain-containing protein n=1 Tax=Cellulomonas endometrii TaxID=3036301 RepID=UPI0024AD32B5|nr:GAF domain-containing protein [Cellulomonas endometrii]